MEVKKKLRNLTIGEIHKGNNKVVPMLRISGVWLEELGFKCGGYVKVVCENGQIIITPDIEKELEKVAQKNFMETEIEKLKIRFENEKEEIQARYVAEQKAKYCK